MLAGVQKCLVLADVAISLVALVAASLSGLWALYFDQAFGTPENYLKAFLWGLRVDSGVLGFFTVVQKLTGAGP